MAKTPVYGPLEFVSALNSDTNKIYNGLTVSQVFDLYGITFRSLPSGRVDGVCRAALSQEKISGNLNINISFNAWYALAKYALDNIGTSAYFQNLAVITLGVYSLKSTAISQIWDGTSNVIANRVPISAFPIYDIFENNIFNQKISTGDYVYTAIFPSALSGKTGNLVLRDMSNDSTLVSQSFTVGQNGQTKITLSVPSLTAGNRYSVNITSMTIFNDKAEYNASLATTINSSFIQNNLYTPYLVGV